MSGKKAISRRRFLRGVGALAAGPYVITSLSRGAEAPSNRIVMGCIGVGGRGGGLMRGFVGRGDVQVVAVCEVDYKRRDAARSHVEKHYAQAARSGTYKGCADYGDFREITARDDIDAVCIATPDHWHCLIAIFAAKSGKDIYCEKPLSAKLAEGRALARVIRSYQRVFQTGSQQRSSRNFRFACELVRNGRIGRLRTIQVGVPGGKAIEPQPVMPVPEGFDYDMWLGPAPWAYYTKERCHYNFRYQLDYAGGKLADWGAHHLDIAQWGNGTDRTGPVEIEGRGDFPRDGIFDAAVNFRFTCTYANGVRLTCCNRFRQGIRFEGTDGWVFVSRRALEAEPESLLRSVIGPGEIHLYESRSHTGDFLDCVRSRQEPAAPVEVAHRSISLCHLGNIAMLLQRKVKWDPDRERFINDPEADRMIGRALRAPWRM